ncbi:hypothetical protein AB3K78_08880 [Leucobacter sp. HNU]|uniref:hypothetical protein n=1 Tax=Leucobacter sp. HNU TaxID=3236805 RepID=UPI003A7F81A1
MSRARGAGDPAHDGGAEPARGPERDPTRMANQPALQTSSGRIWLVMGALFLVLALVPFGLLIFAGSGRSRGLAIVVASTIALVYAIMIVIRLASSPGPRRLRGLAGGMLALAGIALIGIWSCAVIEAGR